MIFNVVVDVIIRHWVKLVTPTEAITGGLGLTIIDLAAYFYADNGLVALTQPERPQRSFDVLTSIFDWVDLRTNMAKTVVMVWKPCNTPGRMSEEAYKRRNTGKGPTFWEHQ